MQILEFDSSLLPRDARLPAFRQGASHFRVDPIGDPSTFHTRWKLLKLGDVNVIRSTTTPIHYRRDRALIEADAQDRVAIHYRIGGTASGMLDGAALQSGPGSAAVWDLAHPLDFKALDVSDLLIVTLPRYMLDEIFAVLSYSCVLPASPELALAANQVGHLLDHPEDVDEEGTPAIGRAVRDLFAVAVMPALQHARNDANADTAILLQSLHRVIDADLRAAMLPSDLAQELGVPVATLHAITEPAGGLDAVTERRRLLGAFQRLSDPGDVTPIALVALKCGLEDLERFRRRFRALFGVSPNKLRAGAPGHLPNWAGAYQVEMSYGAFLKPGG